MSEPNDKSNLFNVLGFGFPENSDQLSSFNKIHKSYSFKANVNNIDPEQIYASVYPKKAPSKTITNVDYHKRTVLAAEIVFRLKDEWSLGHLKLQKLLYLCQNAMKMPIRADFLKQAMGPYDPKLMRSLDKQFEERKWFKFQRDKNVFPKYVPLEKAGEHEVWYNIYFKNSLPQVNFIIETFSVMKTHDVELVATVFACWNELNKKNKTVENEEIIKKVYEWSKEKEKFDSDEIVESIEWMKEKGITPN